MPNLFRLKVSQIRAWSKNSITINLCFFAFWVLYSKENKEIQIKRQKNLGENRKRPSPKFM